MKITDKDFDRFANKIIVKIGNCWEWQGSLDKDGYGQFRIGKKMLKSHKASYIIYIGKISKNRVLDHLCRNRKCVNPLHLEPVTVKENTLRGNGLASKNKKKTHCINGHEFNKQNTRFYKGKRNCRTCNRERMR